MKKILIKLPLLLVILSLILITGYSSDNETYEKPRFLSIGTASSGGAYYPIGIGIANVITSSLGVQTTAQVTGGSIENNILIQEGAVDLGITMTNLLFEAYHGQGDYKKACPDLNLLLNNLSTGIFHVVTLESTGIKSMADLKGKRVVMGPAGGGALNVAQAVWGEYGFTVDDIKATYISYSDGIAALKDGNVDAVVVQSAPPAAAIQELTATTKGVKLIPIEPEMILKITEKYPYLSSLRLSKDVYGLNEDIEVVYAGTCIAINKNLPEAFVYDITKAIFENIEKIQQSHPSAKGLKLETAAKGAPIPIHPGALKYYKEKGVL